MFAAKLGERVGESLLSLAILLRRSCAEAVRFVEFMFSGVQGGENFLFFFKSHNPTLFVDNSIAGSPLVARDHGLRLATKENQRKTQNQL